MRRESQTPKAFRGGDHDHAACAEDALEAADQLARAKGERLTPLRRRVLELVWRSHVPVGAYDLLDSLKKEGKSGGPPTVYRALDFLLDLGLVHRIRSLNAYVGCAHPGERHAGQFLICTGCRSAAEIDDGGVGRAVQDAAARAGFEAHGQTVEISGLCPRCRAAEAEPRRSP
ncbi:MAG: transcriptional repressor [Alphaproteobacteria bacterium]|nr:transcriptional repressor [Alphaproteobacteria bacterium]